jgi:hypothetical protein
MVIDMMPDGGVAAATVHHPQVSFPPASRRTTEMRFCGLRFRDKTTMRWWTNRRTRRPNGCCRIDWSSTSRDGGYMLRLNRHRQDIVIQSWTDRVGGGNGSSGGGKRSMVMDMPKDGPEWSMPPLVRPRPRRGRRLPLEQQHQQRLRFLSSARLVVGTRGALSACQCPGAKTRGGGHSGWCLGLS